MKRKQFEQYLRAHGCFFHHHGGEHDAWRVAGKDVNAMIPRHVEVQPSIMKKVCHTLGIPVPDSK